MAVQGCCDVREQECKPCGRQAKVREQRQRERLNESITEAGS